VNPVRVRIVTGTLCHHLRTSTVPHNLITVHSWQALVALYGSAFLCAVLFVGIITALTHLSETAKK